jgi:hypothetical protein
MEAILDCSFLAVRVKRDKASILAKRAACWQRDQSGFPAAMPPFAFFPADTGDDAAALFQRYF